MDLFTEKVSSRITDLICGWGRKLLRALWKYQEKMPIAPFCGSMVPFVGSREPLSANCSTAVDVVGDARAPKAITEELPHRQKKTGVAAAGVVGIGWSAWAVDIQFDHEAGRDFRALLMA